MHIGDENNFCKMKVETSHYKYIARDINTVVSVNFPLKCVNYGHVCMLLVSMSHLGG